MAYLSKTSTQMLNNALQKLQANTSITNVSPGSVARAMAEIVTTELGDFYSIMNYNTQQNLISTAMGSSLDAIGALYNVTRKNLTQLAAIASGTGSFYFYVTQPYNVDITIPNGTYIYTTLNTYVGQQFSYVTVGDTTITAGYTRAWASIAPTFQSGTYTAGINTLVVIDPTFVPPLGTNVYCTNPKPIQSQTQLESDDSYRARIIAATTTNAGGTLSALRFTALSVPGVRDAVVIGSPYGLATVLLMVVPDANVVTTPLLSQVQQVLVPVTPAGVNIYVNSPTLLPVDVTANLIIDTSIPNLNTASIISSTTNMIARFLNMPSVGTTLVYNQLIQTIMDSNDYILDVTISNFAVNGVQVLRQNYTPNNSEQLVPGSILVLIPNT